MATKNKHQKFAQIEPRRCWVGEEQKICYPSREEAEVAAILAGKGGEKLSVYKCEFGEHWHLSSRR